MKNVNYSDVMCYWGLETLKVGQSVYYGYSQAEVACACENELTGSYSYYGRGTVEAVIPFTYKGRDAAFIVVNGKRYNCAIAA